MMPYYTVKYSKCKSSICWFCSKKLKKENEFEYCCLRRFICFKLFKVENKQIYEDFDSFHCFYLLFIIPYISLSYTIMPIQSYLFYDKVYQYGEDKYGIYYIIIAFVFTLSFSYIFLDILLILIVLLISLPLRLIPIKMLIGFITINI